MEQVEKLTFPFKNTYEKVFQGNEYLVNIKAQEDKLNLLIEEKLSVRRWRGEFSPEDCQNITFKAKFEIPYYKFVEFLVFSLMNKSDKILVDLLSFQDLQLLKAKRSNNTAPKLEASNPEQNNRRYMILTIMAGAKNVHYPLFLNLMNQSDPESLKRTLKRVSEEYSKMKTFDSEARSSSMSSTCNEFWKNGIANYNPIVEENKQLKAHFDKLKEIKKVLKTHPKDIKTMKDDFEVYRKKSELEVKQLRKDLEEVQTELDNTETQFSETQNSFNKDYTHEVEELRGKLSTLSIQLETERKEAKKKELQIDREYNEYYDLLHQDHGNERKLRVQVRKLENEFEQLLKKLDIVSRAKGFSKGRSNSRSKVQRTQFRSSGSRKPVYKTGSNYSSPAVRNNSNKKNKYSPSNRSNNSLRRKSPSAASTGSKKKSSSRNSSEKGSPGNRLYSPSGRPRDNSPNGNQRMAGAVDRVQQAFSPKNKNKGPTKQEIYKRYNGLLKNKRSKHGSNASSRGRPGSSSVYSKNAKRKTSVNRNGSVRSGKSSKSKKGINSNTGKNFNKYEKEIKMKEFEDSSAKKSKESFSSSNNEAEIGAIQEKIRNLEKLLEQNKAQQAEN